MSEQERHEAVLAALERLAEEAGRSWYSADGEGVATRYVVDPDVGIIGKIASDRTDQALMARNAFPDAVGLARLVAEKHVPVQMHGWNRCAGRCFSDEDHLAAWPCGQYRAAAAFAGVDLTADLPPDVARSRVPGGDGGAL